MALRKPKLKLESKEHYHLAFLDPHEQLNDAITQGFLKHRDQPAEKLKYGFWFNPMRPGHTTTPHSHDDDDECLSCVYLLSGPRTLGQSDFTHGWW